MRGTALAIVFSFLAAGCGTTATILRADGERDEGRISGGSPDAIWLVDRAGRQTRVPRKEIVDLEHPGGMAASVGAALVILGLLSVYERGGNCFESGSTGGCLVTFGPGMIGLGMLAWGGTVYASSIHRSKEAPPPAALNESTARAPDAPRPAAPPAIH